MTTYGSILFHHSSEEMTDKEKEELLNRVSAILSEYNAELESYEFAGFPKDIYTILPCSRCKLRTIDTSKATIDETGDIYNSIARVLRSGSLVDGKLMCNECIDA